MGMAFALLPFFQFFRGTPHQLAAIKQLEESVPPGLLEEDADWFQAWKESGYDQQIYMPYFRQLDNKTGGATESASAQRQPWWRRITRRLQQMMSTTKSAPSTETPRQ